MTLADVARASQLAFDASAPARLAIVAADDDALRTRLTEAAGLLELGAAAPLPGVHFAHGAPAGPVAFLFPGQGSQYLGMGADVAMALDPARQVWDELAAFELDGRRVHEIVFPVPVFTDEERAAQQRQLTATEWAQPSIGAASLALLRVLDALGVRADAVAGHSFGEVTALAAAGVLDTAGLLHTARRRGELMRDAASCPGAMVAVALPVDDVRAHVASVSPDLVVANHNHPTQVVVSGPTEAIAALEGRLAAAAGASAVRLPVATAFHSPIVAPSRAPFAAWLADLPLGAPRCDVYATATAAPYPREAGAIRAQLAEQITQPVRFVEQIEALWSRGVRVFVEVGPGSVLTDFVGRILGDRPHVAVATDRKGRHGVAALHEALGRLAVAGVPMDFAPLWAPYRVPSATAVPKTPSLTLRLEGANYGRPYPPAGGARRFPCRTPLVLPQHPTS